MDATRAPSFSTVTALAHHHRTLVTGFLLGNLTRCSALLTKESSIMKTSLTETDPGWNFKSSYRAPLQMAGWLIILLVTSVLQPSSLYSADLPVLQFDIKHHVACVDVAQSGQFKAVAGKRLIQVKIPVSTLVHQGSSQGLLQVLIRFENPDRLVEVIDYSPKTTLATDIVGNIGIETKQDKSAAVGITLAGNQAGIRGSTSADIGSKRGKSVKWQHLPPLELLSASGTIARGSGVYFKLKPSKRTSLEGNRDFVLLLQVPEGWQSGVLHIDCRAEAEQRSSFTNWSEKVTCGHNRFVVALYAANNKKAQGRANRLVSADKRLRQIAHVHRQKIQQSAYPHPGYRLGVLFQILEPRIPSHWLETVLFHVPGSNEPFKEPPLESWPDLPDPVQGAARQYLSAKRQLQLASDQVQQE